MATKKQILTQIKTLVKNTEPEAMVILYGSYARGDNHKHSDIDILIIVDRDQINLSDERKIKYPLYDIEFETGIIISPVVFTRKDWETRHRVTPFYENIQREGIRL